MESPNPSPSTSSQAGIQALLKRLDDQSRQPDFFAQYQQALGLALSPYLDVNRQPRLLPLPEEEELAKWFLFADFLPTDGHTSLIEQVRDLITQHVPEEERIWLDAFRHSYLDLLEVMAIRGSAPSPSLQLRSLGDQQIFDVPFPQSFIGIQPGQILATRVIRGPKETCLPEPILVMSSTIGKAVFQEAERRRQEIEIGTGNFALSEWAEFAKNYGYLILWSLANVRRGTLLEADSRTPFLNEHNEFYLYALAVYEHPGIHHMQEGITEFKDFRDLSGEDPQLHVWTLKESIADDHPHMKARLLLTPTHLFVECESSEGLDSIKHRLAATFGYALHFKGELTDSPPHTVHEVDLLSETYSVPPTIVSVKDDHKRLKTFLETVFLEWAEQPSCHLNGQSPRHWCTHHKDIQKVATLISQMETYDLGVLRNGQQAYDYDILRRHVGLM